jgi:hypothetical protein
MVQCVPRKTSTLIAMSAKVTTGQRRPSMFFMAQRDEHGKALSVEIEAKG